VPAKICVLLLQLALDTLWKLQLCKQLLGFADARDRYATTDTKYHRKILLAFTNRHLEYAVR
jgi:hypothetical protein